MVTITDLNELMSKKEELDPELAGYLSPFPPMGQALRHPLVYQVPYFGEQMNAVLNAQLKAKLTKLESAKRERNWGQIISLYERPWRIQALWSLRSMMHKQELAEQFGWVWTDSENIWQNMHFIEQIIKKIGLRARSYIMSVDERLAFRRMGPLLEVYRGCQERNREGISWTISEEVAKKFGKRLTASPTFIMRTGYVLKENILFYKADRDEFEVVVKHASKVRDVKDQILPV